MDFGLSYFSYNLILGITFSKRFKNFYYSMCYQGYMFGDMLLYIPSSYSLAYSPAKNFWIFNEIKFQKDDGMTESGFMNIAGLTFRYRYVVISAFYNLLYDKQEVWNDYCGFGKYDRRFGFQVKLEPFLFLKDKKNNH